MRQPIGRSLNLSQLLQLQQCQTRWRTTPQKGGLDAAGRPLALELARHNVLLNVLTPGFVRTRISNDPETNVNEAYTGWFQSLFVVTGRLPICREAKPKEIADTIVYFLSDRNTYMNSATVVVDGGMCSSIQVVEEPAPRWLFL